MSVQEAADVLELSVARVKVLCSTKRLKARRVAWLTGKKRWSIDRESVAEFIRTPRPEGRPKK